MDWSRFWAVCAATTVVVIYAVIMSIPVSWVAMKLEENTRHLWLSVLVPLALCVSIIFGTLAILMATGIVS